MRLSMPLTHKNGYENLSKSSIKPCSGGDRLVSGTNGRVVQIKLALVSPLAAAFVLDCYCFAFFLAVTVALAFVDRLSMLIST